MTPTAVSAFCTLMPAGWPLAAPGSGAAAIAEPDRAEATTPAPLSSTSRRDCPKRFAFVILRSPTGGLGGSVGSFFSYMKSFFFLLCLLPKTGLVQIFLLLY